MARQFAAEARPEDAVFADRAWAAGLLHDLGKFRREFQEMLRGERRKGESTRHKQVGAAYATAHRWWDLAFAIGGHHGGLPDRADLQNLVATAGAADLWSKLWAIGAIEVPDLRDLEARLERPRPTVDFDLYVRWLFSCLVDADWLDTSAFCRAARGLQPIEAPPVLRPNDSLAHVLAFIARRARDCRQPELAAIRDQVLRAAMESASSVPGLFSMTVPTGGGKTLSALAFALAHAARHDLRRVIYVAPYLSIIEQNATVIREALGVDPSSGLVLEQHSLADPVDNGDDGDGEAARLAENWDAPIVITTSVQFFESLFSSEPARCRKLHNIARSVVILDECQTLPPGLVTPTLDMLRSMARFAGCSIVFSTATQPAWRKEDRACPDALEDVREIVPMTFDLPRRLRRVSVDWPRPDEKLDWVTVAGRMAESPRCACVVNSRRAAVALFRELRSAGVDNVLHLSTLMCPAHRRRTLSRIRQLLIDRQPCHLVSTQVIEAGVDIDFPSLFREMAPLEAVVQAAGRCNREGLLPGAGGHVTVFRSIDGAGPADLWYKAGIAAVEDFFLANHHEPDLGSPDDLRDYYHWLYSNGSLDARDIQSRRREAAFAQVSRDYRLIQNATSSVVVLGWQSQAAVINGLLDQLRDHPDRDTYRALAPYQVNLYAPQHAALRNTIDAVAAGVEVCAAPYDDFLGLISDAAAQSPVF